MARMRRDPGLIGTVLSPRIRTHRAMHLSELKAKSPAELLSFAEELQVENASSLRKQDMMFAILKQLAENDQAIFGEGTLEILPDGFGFLRSPQANFLPGPDDIYISPAQVRRFGLRTGDTVEGQIRAPKDGERYFALLKVNAINFEPPEALRHRINAHYPIAAALQNLSGQIADGALAPHANGLKRINRLIEHLQRRHADAEDRRVGGVLRLEGGVSGNQQFIDIAAPVRAVHHAADYPITD